MLRKWVWLVAMVAAANLALVEYRRVEQMRQPSIEAVKETRILPEMIPEEWIVPEELLNPTVGPTAAATPIPRRPTATPEPNVTWGVAQQIDEVTWTIKLENDERMATPGEIFDALNDYRRRKGVAVLAWDNNLAQFAQARADHFDEIKSTDKHEGFEKFMEEEDGFEKLGFTWLGENSSYGYRLEGVHLIEWVFAGDEPHDQNQSHSRWAYVGIGVRGTAVDIIFGTGKK